MKKSFSRDLAIEVIAVSEKVMSFEDAQKFAAEKGEPCSRLFGRRGYYLAVRDVRKNPKRFREFVEKMNANAERIAKAFRAQKFDAVWDYV